MSESRIFSVPLCPSRNEAWGCACTPLAGSQGRDDYAAV